MLKRFITAANYRMDSYQYFNDRLIYIDFIDRKYEYDETTVTPVDGYRFQGNLMGLFKFIGIEDDLLPFALYLNGYTNPVEYDGVRLTFKVPKMPPIPEY